MSRVVISNHLIVGALLAFVAHSAPAFSQSTRARADSVDTRKRALRMQTWFERVRHMNLPVRFSGGAPPCDAYIGRFCQWNDDSPRVPKEPDPIREGRDRLLRALDSAAARSPGDDWIAGQRIRYLVEAGRDSDAVQAARSCAATRWWCDALTGLALHELGDYAASDSAFHDALEAMPSAERCRWTDVSILLDDAQRKRYGKVGCGRNEALAQHLWWLADPFLAIPGNDRETEHYSRHVMSRILDGTIAGYAVQWGDDLRQLVVRYGWSRYWSRAPGTAWEPYSGQVSGHEATPNYHFFPASAKVFSPREIGDATWDFNDRLSVERYSPAVATTFGGLDAQLVFFRRGDSVQVVAAYDLTPDTALAGPAAHTALVIQRDERALPLISESIERRGWYSVTIDSVPRLLSLETWNADRKRGGRIRRGISLPPLHPGEVAVSDLLLFDAASGDGGSLTSILPLALGNLTIEGTRKLGLYWETYGLARPDSALPVSLTLSRVSTGLRKLAEAIGLGKNNTPMSIAWRETPTLGGVATRSVVLDLSLIPRGRYRLKLELTPRAGPPISSTRIIEIL
jgi:hypothetical protein